MGYTDNIIELMRGITSICSDAVIDVISSQEKCEDLYKDIFTIYGLEYNTETIKQKRAFVAAVTEYFILKRCSDIKQSGEDNKYGCEKKSIARKAVANQIDNYFKIRQKSISNQDFKEKFAQCYNEEVKDFSKEIAENRDDSLSDFAKAIEKLYYFKDKD